MSTRITIDLQNPSLLTLLKLEAAHTHKLIREIIVEALEGYFSSKKENQAILKLAEKTFAEWDNPKDSEYDSL